MYMPIVGVMMVSIALPLMAAWLGLGSNTVSDSFMDKGNTKVLFKSSPVTPDP